MKHLTLEMKRSAQEVVSDTLSYSASAGTTAYGFLTLDNLYTVVGILFLVATFLTNLWYKIKLLEIAREHNSVNTGDD